MSGHGDRVKRLALRAIVAGLAAAGIAGFIMFGPPRLAHYLGSPEFCGTRCHVMLREYQAWNHSPHRQIRCIDCHLPNDNLLNYYVWKGIDGTRDLIYFYGNFVPEPIEASDHAKETVETNCRRCHGQMVSRISTEGRYCWDCHRAMRHDKAGILEAVGVDGEE